MKAQNTKIERNEAQKTKMKGNEGPKTKANECPQGQNKRK